MDDALNRGRQLFARLAWRDACTQLSAIGLDRLEIDDLERLAVAAHLGGMPTDSDEAWTRAYHECLRAGTPSRAARSAFWLAFRLLNAGDVPRARGWIGRARRHADAVGQDSVERGYVLYLEALQAIFAGDAAAACTTFGMAAEIGERFADPDLLTLARHGQGRALILLGHVAEGVALLDEAMVAITAGEVSPIVVGDTYCSVIEACQEILDVGRARAWTQALTRWCGSQPELVPYRGQCLVHRAEMLQLRGAWGDAVAEVSRACELLSDPPGQPAVGAAHYQQGERHRLRGEFRQAEAAYRRANESGRDPQPGLALLRLAQGRTDVAIAAIRRAVDEADDRATRSRLLPAYVEIMLAVRDTEAARAVAEELAQLVTPFDVPLARAVAASATGAVMLAEGDARTALLWLRKAFAAWVEIDAPYEAARVRVMIALACQKLGDGDTARMHLEAARGVFAQILAAPDLARLVQLVERAAPNRARGLSRREVEVLYLVAAGETNKAIAGHLGLSERTVDRHVSNILAPR